MEMICKGKYKCVYLFVIHFLFQVVRFFETRFFPLFPLHMGILFHNIKLPEGKKDTAEQVPPFAQDAEAQKGKMYVSEQEDDFKQGRNKKADKQRGKHANSPSCAKEGACYLVAGNQALSLSMAGKKPEVWVLGIHTITP